MPISCWILYTYSKTVVDRQENGSWNCMRCNLFHFVVNIFCNICINGRCLKWLLSALSRVRRPYVLSVSLRQVCAIFKIKLSSFSVYTWHFASTRLTHWSPVSRWCTKITEGFCILIQVHWSAFLWIQNLEDNDSRCFSQIHSCNINWINNHHT